jgi:hypothetical protein
VPASDWRAAGARIDALIATERDEELVRLVTGLYGAGLERLLTVLHEGGGLTDATVAAVADDELISALLLVHGLHPYDTATRVRRALAGTGASLVEVTADGVCHLRVAHGQPSPALHELIEAVAPEVTGIEFDNKQPLIPVESLFSRVAAEPS